MRITKYPARPNAAPIISLDRNSTFKVGDAALNDFVIAKYSARSNEAPNNFVNEVYVRVFHRPARGKLGEPDFYLERFPIAGSKDLTRRTSSFEVGDAGLNKLMKRNFYPEAFCEEARCWSAAFSSRSFTNAKSTRFAGAGMPSSLPRRAT
jgi:hypothetical protein